MSIAVGSIGMTCAMTWAAAAADGMPDGLAAAWEALPLLTAEAAEPFEGDWLIEEITRPAGVYRTEVPGEVVISNGLASRAFRLAPNGATVGYDDLTSGEPLIRGVKPEAKVTLDGTQYDVGGLVGQEEYAYLRTSWLADMTSDPGAFQLVAFEVGQPREPFGWKRARHATNKTWPPKGTSLRMDYTAPGGAPAGVAVAVHYELYDGIPLLCKWVTVSNGAEVPVKVDAFSAELLAVVEYDEMGAVPQGWMPPNMHIETDYAFGGYSSRSASHTVYWEPDPRFTTSRYGVQSSVLNCRPPMGPGVTLAPGEALESFRVFELLLDNRDRDRASLARCRMFRTIAPWVTENPLFTHVLTTDPEAIKSAVGQCAEVGFEMAIMSFGSGIDVENTDPEYMARWREVVEYARAKGVELGAYSLLASRSVGPETDVIDPTTGRPGGAMYGSMPCLGSEWGEEYLAKLRTFYSETGLTLLEHDGSYPGDVCASTVHPGHKGLEDSQWVQWRRVTDLYKWCVAEGVYLNIPDWYFLSGGNRIFMPYREENWSLPRDRQILLARQNIFDGTVDKPPTMGWMFLALTQYKGGGAAATIEPLNEHLDTYGAHLAQNLGSGVQCCYRGPRLYDTEETKHLVKSWVDFYKDHRAILDSDIVHVRRPNGRTIDCMLHVNPRLREKGLAMVYNPLRQPVDTTLKLPLYYTGLTDEARVSERGSDPVTYPLARDYTIRLPIRMGPESVTWFVVE